MKKLLALALALGMMLTVMSVGVFAAEPPFVDLGSSSYGVSFFAEGKPVVIFKEGEATKLTCGGKTYEAPAGVDIYGGGNNDGKTYPTSSITMNGGTVGSIAGGSFKAGKVTEANVIVNGGVVQNVYGGGLAGVGSGTGFSLSASQKPGTAACAVMRTHVVINGGTISTAVFGGGNGYSYNGNTNVEVNNGNIFYLLSGGANGYTDNGTLNIRGGTITVAQGINRGIMGNSTINMYGGAVTNLFVGGEDPESWTGDIVNGEALGSNAFSLNVFGGTVDALTPGSNGTKTMTAGNESINAIASVGYNPDNAVIKNMDALAGLFGNKLRIITADSEPTEAEKAQQAAVSETTTAVSEAVSVLAAAAAGDAEAVKELAKTAETVTTAAGETLTAPVISIDSTVMPTIPWNLGDAMSGQHLLLKVKTADGYVYINTALIPKCGANRIFWPMSYLIQMFGITK